MKSRAVCIELGPTADGERLCEVLRHLAENSKHVMPNGRSFAILLPLAYSPVRD